MANHHTFPDDDPLEDELSLGSVVAFSAEIDRRDSRPRAADLAQDDDRDPTAMFLRTYLNKHVDRRIELSELSELVGLSVYQISRRFRDAFGVPPMSYHLRLRTAIARRLRDQGVLLRSVAERLGFVDESHVSRHLKNFGDDVTSLETPWPAIDLSAFGESRRNN